MPATHWCHRCLFWAAAGMSFQLSQIICNCKGKSKGRFLIQHSLRDYRTSAFYNLGSGSWLAKANGAAAQTAAIQLRALTYNWTRVMQLANTPPLQSTTPGLHPVSIHQISTLVRRSKHPITAYYSIYRPRKDERLSRPAWLVTYRNKVPSPGVEPVHVIHPSTNRARRRVTSLTRPTLLLLCHAATCLPYYYWSPAKSWVCHAIQPTQPLGLSRSASNFTIMVVTGLIK